VEPVIDTNNEQVNNTQTQGQTEDKGQVKGIFDHISDIPDLDKMNEVTNQNSDTGKPPSSESQEQEKTTPETNKEGETTQQKVSVLGKEFTVDELVKAYENSSSEGYRLYKINKEMEDRIREYEAKLIELENKLQETPPFKLLSDEEVEALSPKEQVEYLFKKREWEKQKEEKKSKLEQIKKEEESKRAILEQKIIKKADEMSKDGKTYPYYNEIVPIMDYVIKYAPFITGYEETPDIVYFTALGMKYYKSLKDKDTIERNQAETIKNKTSTSANATNSVNSGLAGTKNTPNEMEELFDFNYNKPIFKR